MLTVYDTTNVNTFCKKIVYKTFVPFENLPSNVPKKHYLQRIGTLCTWSIWLAAVLDV